MGGEGGGVEADFIEGAVEVVGILAADVKSIGGDSGVGGDGDVLPGAGGDGGAAEDGSRGR